MSTEMKSLNRLETILQKNRLFDWENWSNENLLELFHLSNTKYAEGKSIIEDVVYDSLYDYGVSRGLFTKTLSTVYKEGQGSKGNEYPHFAPMISLTALHIDNDFTQEKLDTILKRWIDTTNVTMVFKYDGCALNIQYVDGKLFKILTRAENIIGIDQTEKFRSHVPQTINVDLDSDGNIVPQHKLVELRAEAVVPCVTFDNKYSKELKTGKFKNERSFVSGVMNTPMKSIDMDMVNDIDIKIFKYVSIDSDKFNDTDSFKNRITFSQDEYTNLRKLIGEDSKNLPSVIFDIDMSDTQNIISTFNRLKVMRPSFKYRTDGVIIILNSDSDITPSNEYMNSYALKFDAVKGITTIIDYVWSQKADGNLFAKAILKPIELDGTTVSRPSVNNLNIIMQGGLGIGAEVEVIKSGDIIPHITKTIKRVELNENDFDSILNAVGVDESEGFVEWYTDSDGDRILRMMSKGDSVKKRFVGGCLHLDIDNSGESMFSDIYDQLLHIFNDRYNVGLGFEPDEENETPQVLTTQFLYQFTMNNTYDDWCLLLGFRSGLKSIKEVYTNLRNRFSNLDLNIFIHSLRFNGIGKSTSLELAKQLSGVKYDLSGKNSKAIRIFENSYEYDWINENMNLFNTIEEEPEIELAEGTKVYYYMLTGKPKAYGFKDKKDFTKRVLDVLPDTYILTTKFTEMNLLLCEDVNGTSSKIKKANAKRTKEINVGSDNVTEIKSYQELKDIAESL